MEHDPLWSSSDLATIVTKIIESIRLIPNTTTKLKPFEAHFGRPPNTELSNIITKPSSKNLSYKLINKFASDQATLRHPALPREIMWDWDNDSEPELNIEYKAQSQPTPHTSDTDDSENALLVSHTRVPGKIIPDKLQITFGDKTSLIICNRKNFARKSIARKAPEPRGTLKPQWNIIQDGTITNYSPHTITLDTTNRKNTVIRKNDLAIVTEKIHHEPEPKPRLMHMVACKTVGEYKQNQEKIRKFCSEEKAEQARQQESKAIQSRSAPLRQAAIPQPSNIINTRPIGHEEVVAVARKNQRAQKRPRTAPTTRQPKQVQKSQKLPLKPKSPGTQARPQWLKNAKARLTKPSEFDQKSKAAALQQSKAAALQQSREDNLNKRKQLYSSSSDNPSYTSINKQKLKFSTTAKIMSIESDSPGTPPIEIITSSNPNDFMQDTNE